jgi:HEPN domain-containing protein
MGVKRRRVAMNEAVVDYIRKWLVKAEHDLLNAQTVVEHNPIILDTACFHCQQAVEKYLKAFLVYKGIAVERTHNLNYLLDVCSQQDNDFKNIETKNLNDFGVEIRYPDNFLSPSMEETKEYIQMVLDIKNLVSGKIHL